MTNSEEGDTTDQTPNFELPRHDVIHEDNWLEYQSRGFEPVVYDLAFAQMFYGVGHVYTGDAYDYEEERPLRHSPGIGVYVDPEGLAQGDEARREWKEWHRRREEGKQS